MFEQLISILQKTKERGFTWLYHRSVLEFRIPETTLGKQLKPINIFIYQLFALLVTPLRCLFNRKCLRADTLYVFYDLEVCPITFNLCEALGMANVERIRLGLNYLHVVFVPGPNEGLRHEMEDYESFVDKDARHWRKHNLLFPLTHLVSSCIGFSNCSSRQEAALLQRTARYIFPNRYSTQFPIPIPFFEGARNPSSDVMSLKATPKALSYIRQWLAFRSNNRKIIVITLRQYTYMPKRNSNITAWSRFAKQLDPQEYFVVIVPDTEVAVQKPLPEFAEFEHCFEACWNIELRAALYETAFLNLGINNGPFSLCWLNPNCRYIMFKIITEEVAQTTEEAQRKHGLIPGVPPAFALPYQKWVWEPDTEETIQREFLNTINIR